MSIKLLPASVNPVDSPYAPDAPTSLALLTQRAIATNLTASAGAFAWSSSRRRGEANRINGTLVEDSNSDQAERSGWEYVSGWAWSHPVERTAVAHYLFYATAPGRWSGWLIDLYV